jgi:hypothetical protein
MENTLLIIMGILGVGISVVVKLIFVCMGAEGQQQQQPEQVRRRRSPAARRRP